MLKKEIKYEDFNGDTQTETFYFNLSQSELLAMIAEQGDERDFQGWLESLIKNKNYKDILATFRDLILNSYGEKSEDGKRFVKNDEMRNNFHQSAAYETLFVELLGEDRALVTFMLGVVPKDMAKNMEEAMKKFEASIAQKRENVPET